MIRGSHLGFSFHVPYLTGNAMLSVSATSKALPFSDFFLMSAQFIELDTSLETFLLNGTKSMAVFGGFAVCQGAPFSGLKVASSHAPVPLLFEAWGGTAVVVHTGEMRVQWHCRWHPCRHVGSIYRGCRKGVAILPWRRALKKLHHVVVGIPEHIPRVGGRAAV